MSARTAEFGKRQIWLAFLRRHLGEVITPEMGIAELIKDGFWDQEQLEHAQWNGLAKDFRAWAREIKVDDEGNLVELVNIRTVNPEGEMVRGYADITTVQSVQQKIQVIEDCWNRGVENLREFIRLHDYFATNSTPAQARKIRHHFESRYRQVQELLNLVPIKEEAAI